MKKNRQRQIELPGLEEPVAPTVADSRAPAECEFPVTPPTAQMGADRTERSAEPVEAKSVDARSVGEIRLCD